MVFTPTEYGYAQNHYAGERTEVAAGRQPETGGGATATGTGVAKCLKLRKEYEEAVKERCKDGKEDIKAVLKSVKNSFDDDLLETLCEVNWCVPKDELLMSFCWSRFAPPLTATRTKCCRQSMSFPEGTAHGHEQQGHHGASDQLLHGVQHVDQEPTAASKDNKNKKDEGGPKGTSKAGCFNCGGPHYLSACPTATKEDRERLASSNNIKKGGEPPRGGTANLRRLADCLPTQTRSIVLGDAFKVAFCADSGADRSGMSVKVYEQFVEACPESEQAVELEEPRTCKGADGNTIEVKMTVKLHLKLTTAAGSVRIAKPVECLVIPGDSTEFLLGNDLLTTLGIDVLRQLDMLVANAMRGERDDEFDDVDEPQIGSSAAL
ncbi:unnamed protein product [Phytophthora fragariaefolia]|uniref:Unnamed protein product n=1 Tax=Phytophthora fragariaefolia TaxID=1490495 RepID=A0A9W6YN94_9STRA|nr:unnamed protein product [Phytophthora fragariaefolia]